MVFLQSQTGLERILALQENLGALLTIDSTTWNDQILIGSPQRLCLLCVGGFLTKLFCLFHPTLDNNLCAQIVVGGIEI